MGQSRFACGRRGVGRRRGRPQRCVGRHVGRRRRTTDPCQNDRLRIDRRCDGGRQGGPRRDRFRRRPGRLHRRGTGRLQGPANPVGQPGRIDRVGIRSDRGRHDRAAQSRTDATPHAGTWKQCFGNHGRYRFDDSQHVPCSVGVRDHGTHRTSGRYRNDDDRIGRHGRRRR